MARLLMSLRDVPADEYEDVCSLLDQHRLEHYRIEPSRWGLHGGGLWLVDGSRFEETRALLETYQAERARHARAEWQAERAAGTAPSLLEQVRQQPLRMAALGLALLMALALTVLPFVWLMGFWTG